MSKPKPRPPRRKRPQDAAALQPLLADIVESSYDAIFSRALDGTVTSWNGAAERIFGYRAKEILGKSSTVLLPKDRPHEQAEFLERIRRGERVEDFETVRLRKDGRSIAVSLTVSPIRDARGRVIGASTFARDITEQRRLEAELLEISERERQRMGQDLHDGLGQQLTGMELLCRTLARSLEKRRLPESETARVLIAQLRAAVEQTRALAHGLVPVIDSPNGLMLALQDFAANAELLFGIRCVFQCTEPVLIEEHTTAVHLYRIVQEAVSNAVRHGKARRITILLRKGQRGTSLTVSSDGVAFKAPPESHSGIGLRIMRYRAEMSGALLAIERGESGGTRVSCVLNSRPSTKEAKLA